MNFPFDKGAVCVYVLGLRGCTCQTWFLKHLVCGRVSCLEEAQNAYEKTQNALPDHCSFTLSSFINTGRIQWSTGYTRRRWFDHGVSVCGLHCVVECKNSKDRGKSSAAPDSHTGAPPQARQTNDRLATNKHTINLTLCGRMCRCLPAHGTRCCSQLPVPCMRAATRSTGKQGVAR